MTTETVEHSGRRSPTPPGGVTMTEAVRRVLSKYADFSGRAPRSEYWWWVLAMFLLSLVLSFAAAAVASDAQKAADIATGVLLVATFLPSLAVTVRRLHDTDRSGWWILVGLVPIIGSIILLVWMASEGSHRANQWGPPVSEVSAPG